MSSVDSWLSSEFQSITSMKKVLLQFSFVLFCFVFCIEEYFEYWHPVFSVIKLPLNCAIWCRYSKEEDIALEDYNHRNFTYLLKWVTDILNISQKNKTKQIDLLFQIVDKIVNPQTEYKEKPIKERKKESLANFMHWLFIVELLLC